MGQTTIEVPTILNTTPRQCLAWKTPMQVYFGRCANNTETVQEIRDGAIAATRKLNSYTDKRQTRGPRGPWVAHLRKRSKVTVEPILENPRGII